MTCFTCGFAPGDFVYIDGKKSWAAPITGLGEFVSCEHKAYLINCLTIQYLNDDISYHEYTFALPRTLVQKLK